MEKKSRKKRIIIALVNAVLVLISAVCFLVSSRISGMLLSQQAAERWKGESEMDFAQISCFIPADQPITIEDVNTFRQVMITRFKEAALEVQGQLRLYSDAWSTGGKVTVSSSLGRGEVYAYAVGGDFFSFHPIRLRSGNYITSEDLMQDRVILDEATAWLLYGSNDVHGQELKINEDYFVVAGVIQREDDFASSKAFTDEMGIFMSYDAYTAMNETAGIQCYEVVMPERVNGFAYAIATDKFPVGRGEILNNSTRFSPSRLLKIAGMYGVRSMQSNGVIYPYWENAARYTEDIAALLTSLAAVAAIFPLVCLVYIIIKLLIHGKKYLEERIPQLSEEVGERIRKRQYERLLKKHKFKH